LGDDGVARLRRIYFCTAALPKAESYINPHDRYWDYLPLTGALNVDKLLTTVSGSLVAANAVMPQERIMVNASTTAA
jgi:hypothetical protein